MLRCCVVVVVSARGSRECNVYVHTNLRMQRQSLRLIELVTCVMSSYPQSEESYKPPPAPARPPRLRAFKEWTTVSMTSTTRTSTTVKRMHLGQLCTCGIDCTTCQTTENCTRTCGISAVFCTVCTVSVSVAQQEYLAC